MKRSPLSGYSRLALLLPMAAVAVLVGVAPFFAALRGSFLHDYFGEISPAGLDNYRYILGDKAFGYSLNISVLWAFLQTLFTVSIALLVAYRLWMRRFGSRRRSILGRITDRATFRQQRKKFPLLHLAVLVPWGVPVYIAVPVWRALIHGDGEPFNLLLQPVPAFTAALGVSVWLSLPATIFLFLSGFKKIGRQMVEAAAIDGADDSVIAFSICFPQLREILLSAVLINFVKALKEFTVVFLMTAGGPPLMSGITEKYIVGATTTLSVFLYDLFLSSGDYGVSSAFSVLLALVVFTATLLYLLGRAHGEPRWKRLLMAVPLIVQLLTGGPAAIPMAILYGVVLFSPRCFSWVLLIHATLMGGLLYLKGFPAGLQPALALAAAVWLIQRGRSIRLFSPRSAAKPQANLLLRPKVWAAVREIIPLTMIAAAIVMTGALLWLSFSGVDAVSFDSLLPPAPGFRAYRMAVGEENIFRYFFNSFVVALSTAVLLPLITFPAGWVIAKRGGRTGAIVLASIQLIGTISGMHALIPLYIIFRSLGLINTYAALVLIYLEHAFVFSLYTTSAFLRDLPASLHEAALLEGAGTFYYLRKVLLPLSRPIVFTTMIVAFLGAWNGFLPALLFIRDDWKYTIGVKIYTFVGSIASGSPRWSLFAATSVINMIFLLLLFNLLRKRGGATALSDIEE